MSASQRSIKVWAVIALTLCVAIYFSWAVIASLNVIGSVRPLRQADYYAYVPGASAALFLLFTAYSAFRGYRRSLFLYQLILVFLALQVFLYLPGLWQVVSQIGMSSAGRNATNVSFWIVMALPLLKFAAALFSAIVVYREIYSKPTKRRSDTQL